MSIEIKEFFMYITKSSVDSNGTMRWSAVNSDTDYDSYEERMSLDLYRDFILYIKGEKELAQEFKSLVYSDYWQGGMPYLSISHYPDLNGKAVPGKPHEIFVDGNCLKAKGTLFNNPLGHSVYRSLKEDKNKQPEEKIRISIGFLDLAHRHGNGKVWVRESAYSICPECLQGIGDKVYVQGCLVHLALTRVPVNKRTEMVLEEKADMTKKKTRKEDAASIIGETEAEKIEMAQKASQQRSDVLIEMSDAEPVEEPVAEVEEVNETEEVEPTEPEVTPDEPIVTESETSDTQKVTVEKFEDDAMGKVVNEAYPVANLPFGGATSMREAEAYVAAKDEAIYLMDMWSVFSNVIWNIMDRPDITEKRSAMNQAVDEFKNVLTAKAMVTFSATVEKSEISESHELQPAIDALLEKVDNSIGLVDIEKAEVLNPAMQELGVAITGYLEKKSVVQDDEPPAKNENNDTLLKDIKELIQPLSEGLKVLSEEVGVLKAKSAAQTIEVKPRIPQSRTYKSSVMEVKSEEQPKPNSLKAIARKSVGL